MRVHRMVCMLVLVFAVRSLRAADYPAPQPGNFVVKDFQFKSGERLEQVNLHYYTLGSPQADASGKVRNAILILHGTGGSGRASTRRPRRRRGAWAPGDRCST